MQERSIPGEVDVRSADDAESSCAHGLSLAFPINPLRVSVIVEITWLGKLSEGREEHKDIFRNGLDYSLYSAFP